MSLEAKPTKRRGVRVILREFLEQVLEGQDEILLPDVIASAKKRFADDEDFHRALLDDALGLLVADALRAYARHHRFHPTEAGFVSVEKIDAKAKDLAARMFESLGDGRRKSLLTMNRLDLDYAIAQRRQMIGGLVRWNSFASELRNGLRDDAQTVGDRYSDDEFERLWARHFDLSDAGQLRLAATP